MNTPEWTDPPPRAQLLDEAMQLVMGDRNQIYGPPYEHHSKTAALWTILFGHQFTAADVAKAFIVDKLVRLRRTEHKDGYADIVGYAACGYESMVEEHR